MWTLGVPAPAGSGGGTWIVCKKAVFYIGVSWTQQTRE